MSTKLSNGCSKYGADMGRRSFHSDVKCARKFKLERICGAYQAYDNGGAYWGTGANIGAVYMATADDTSTDLADESTAVEWYLRATSREHAKAQIVARYPGARFYR